VTIGKGLGGGYAPIAAVLVGKKVVDVLRQGTSVFNHGHTYQAHPASCATALAVQRIVRREKLVDRCAAMGRVFEVFLRNALEGCKYVGDIRGKGLFWTVEFVKDKKTKKSFDQTIGFGLRVQKAAFERGVAVYRGGGTVHGIEGDHVLLAPPYTVMEENLREVVEVLREAYDSQETYVDRLEWK
jgi:adenosylmethionine-8-amino-7-oxononanoate aminotransferase